MVRTDQSWGVSSAALEPVELSAELQVWCFLVLEVFNETPVPGGCTIR